MSTLYIIADRVFFTDPTFCGIFVCGPLLFKCQFCYLFWGRRSFIDPICCSFLHGFAHVSKVGFVHPIFSLCDINATLGLSPSRRHAMWRGSVSVGVECQGSKTE